MPDDIFTTFDELERLEAAASSVRWEVFKGAPVTFRQARKDLGDWSQRRLAEELEVSISIIGRIEQGKVMPGRPLLAKLRTLYRDRRTALQALAGRGEEGE